MIIMMMMITTCMIIKDDNDCVMMTMIDENSSNNVTYNLSKKYFLLKLHVTLFELFSFSTVHGLNFLFYLIFF